MERTSGFVWKCWVNIPNEIAIFHRDCLISKTIGYNGVHDIFRHTQMPRMTAGAVDPVDQPQHYGLCPAKSCQPIQGEVLGRQSLLQKIVKWWLSSSIRMEHENSKYRLENPRDSRVAAGRNITWQLVQMPGIGLRDILHKNQFHGFPNYHVVGKLWL